MMELCGCRYQSGRSRFLPRNSLLDLLKSFYPRLHMRYPFGGVVQIKTNLILWYPYIVGPLELYIMPSEDVSKTANWDSLFDTYKVKFLRNLVSAT